MKKTMLMLTLIVMVVAFAACKKEAVKLAYPETKKVDQVDDYFGTKVADPYRWLEDDNAEDTKAWVEAQNKVTFGYLDTVPYRPKIKARLTEIFNYPRYSSPFRVGEYYFFVKNDGLQNQSVYYVQKGLDGTPEVFIDPNALSADGTIRVGMLGSSLDDKLHGRQPRRGRLRLVRDPGHGHRHQAGAPGPDHVEQVLRRGLARRGLLLQRLRQARPPATS